MIDTINNPRQKRTRAEMYEGLPLASIATKVEVGLYKALFDEAREQCISLSHHVRNVLNKATFKEND